MGFREGNAPFLHRPVKSHGQALLAFISGLPAQLPIHVKYINHELRRRQLGYGRGGRRRSKKGHCGNFRRSAPREDDRGADCLADRESRLGNWEKILPVEAAAEDPGARKLVAPRPGHADLAGSQKFNYHDARYILERASARETAARVAAGALQNCFCGNSTQKSQVIRFRWGTCAWKNLPRGRKIQAVKYGPGFSFAVYRRCRTGKNENGG